MKKKFILFFAAALCAALLEGCSASGRNSDEAPKSGAGLDSAGMVQLSVLYSL